MEEVSTCASVDLQAGLPPGLLQVQSPPRRVPLPDRVSIGLSKCRSSLYVVEKAARRLKWRTVDRDTPEVSVVWLENADSSMMVCPCQVMTKVEGVRDLCRKADLATCMHAMKQSFPQDFMFAPPTWIISQQYPEQLADLQETMLGKRGWTYICKPTSGSLGRGVKLVQGFADLKVPIRSAFPQGAERLRPAEFVVQRYVARPLLLEGYKFDCRCYVIITSVVPLRGYLFKEGLARFCTTKYEKPRNGNLRSTCMHLTNYAVNKKSTKFNTSQAHDEGSKRSLTSALSLVESHGGPTAASLWSEIKAVAEKTLLALRPKLVEGMADPQGSRGALHPAGPKGYHVIGFDILFDSRYRAVLLELNSSSSMSVMQPSAASPDADAFAAGQRAEPLLPKEGSFPRVTATGSDGAARAADGGVPAPSPASPGDRWTSSSCGGGSSNAGAGSNPGIGPGHARVASARGNACIDTSSKPKQVISELDVAVKVELNAQALLCANPLPHGGARRRRSELFEGASVNRVGVCPRADEPLPLNDDGAPVHDGVDLRDLRPDAPQLCPALEPLGFEAHGAFGYVRAHLRAYRVWRHYAFHPPGSVPLRKAGLRRYLGFGRKQFRELCEAAGLVPGAARCASGQWLPCWPDRAAAELFFAGALRGSKSDESASQNAAVALDFALFVRRIALPVGAALAEDPEQAGGSDEPMQAFANRVYPTLAAAGSNC